MFERHKQVRAVQTTYVCDNCKSGLMRPTGHVLMTSPPLYAHACCNCGCRKNFRFEYPRTTYEPVEADHE